jgi:hypothetical protein
VDNGNFRVLRFDNPKSLGNGATANAVLGQTTFTANTSGSGQNGFGRPDGVAASGTSLYVSDALESRVLRFDNVMTLANGANASGVLGQINFTNTSSALTQSGLNTPSGLGSDASGALYVADLYNNRILIFKNANSLANGANATFVLLQTNFTSNGVPVASQSTGGYCSTLALDNTYGALLALDRSDSRFLLFNASGPILGEGNIAVNSSAISVYPNPGNGVFNLSISNYELGSTNTVEVYNMLGEQVYSAGLNSSIAKIDLSNNAAGIYLVRIVNSDGSYLAQSKIVKTK